MKITKHSANVHDLNIHLKNVKDSFKLGIFSDVHFDSKHCHRELFKKHIEQCDGFVVIGDFFDVMGAWRDPRSKPQDIRPEYYTKERSYLDAVVQDAHEFLKPYKDKILLLGFGNHETNIMKRQDTNLLDRLSFLLRMDNDCQVQTGGYSGFLKIVFKIGKRSSSVRKIMYYHHGYGGNAVRSKDMLKSQLDSFKVPQADIIVSGHTHTKVHDPSNVRLHLGDDNKIKYKHMDWIKTGSYKRNDIDPEIGGWEVEKGFMPTKMGGWFVDFNPDLSNKGFKIHQSVIEAK